MPFAEPLLTVSTDILPQDKSGTLLDDLAADMVTAENRAINIAPIPQPGATPVLIPASSAVWSGLILLGCIPFVHRYRRLYC